MSFLKCAPTVFVIGREYEILVNTVDNGLVYVEVGGEIYYEENSGVLSTEKNYTKVRIPQGVLNNCPDYTVCYRKSVDRRAYFSQMGEVERLAFSFKPLTKTADINIYHISDVHYGFSYACEACSYFGEDTDLFVVNGDIGEVETVQNYEEVCKFCGDISGGEIPVIFVRGNHDTRGKLAERFTDYFPANGKNTYFDFEIGCLCGVALDCGEDKVDTHEDASAMREMGASSPSVYGGVNSFPGFRRRQLELLRGLELDGERIRFAVCHIPPNMTTEKKGGCFDIERELYTEWTRELERMGIQMMLCGHLHRTFLLEKGDERNTVDHEYPVIVGAEPYYGSNIYGTAIVLNRDRMTVSFTDREHKIKDSFEVKI